LTATTHTESLVSVLTYIQAHIDDDLSLEHVARLADLSPFHFHRIFRTAVGETLKDYTLRLRMERAGYYLIVQDASILEIAFGVGFRAHETFTRAFQRHFGTTPLAYRRARGSFSGSEARQSPESDPPELLNRLTTHFELSRVTLRKLNPIQVAFIRTIGPYTDVDVTLYDRLIGWAESRGLYTGHNLLIGMGHDAPSITPPEKLRFDACLQVFQDFKPEGEIGWQEIPGETYAAATYIGPYGPTMEQAYASMFHQMMAMKDIEIVGLPAIEIYHTTRINRDYALNQTDLYLPVRKVGE
jgi:AraC family transcriptional regulator